MTTVFVVCAAIGGTILVLQFLLALVGLGGDAMGIDVPHDIGHDVGGMDHDFSAGVSSGGDAHVELGHDSSPGGDHGDTQHANGGHHGSASLFRMLSLRTVVAALAFFGLAGLAADAAGCTPLTTVMIAAAAGAGAMYAVFAMLQGIQSLRAEGTVRIRHALGKEATVYLHVPGGRKGAGKIQINLQNRTMEYLAITAGDPIPTGAAVVITEILGSDTVEVQPVFSTPKPERSAHV
jgi:hypothetical protein